VIRGPRLNALLVVAALAAGGVPAAASAQTVPDPSSVPQLTPETTDPAPAPAPAKSAPKAAKAPEQALPSALPNTGMDGRILGGLGLGLVLCGVGLRLRTARERF
jgi:hypothetical protein